MPPCYNGEDSLAAIPNYKENMENLTFKLVTNEQERKGAFEVRRQVFVQEQGVSEELEYDGQDEAARHIVVKEGGRVIGTARVRFLGNNRAKIERMAILKPFRRKGIGKKVIAFLKRELKRQGIAQVILHAQCDVTGFYKSCGFEETGAPFWEADIKHIKMQLKL